VHAKEKTRTLISAGFCRPECRGARSKARPIPELCRRLSPFPLEARYFFVCSGQRTDAIWEKCPRGTRILAHIKAENSLFLACHPFQRGERKTDHALHCSIEVIGWVRVSLATPLLISYYGTHIIYHHDNTGGCNLVIGRIRVMVAGHFEAAPASITRTRPWLGTKCELAYCCCIAVRGLTTSCQETLHSA
jgi:hypothetical protein